MLYEVMRFFDAFNEKLRVFIEKKKDFGLLKILRFSGRNPDRRNYFSAAYALEKYGRGVHAAAPDLSGCSAAGFLTDCISEARASPGFFMPCDEKTAIEPENQSVRWPIYIIWRPVPG